ncbi:putative transcription factor Hap3/NF-YB family [Helianthus annuus]|nr:putative transcription factor Hap3/NF-YB family [Helianthus annuus]
MGQKVLKVAAAVELYNKSNEVLGFLLLLFMAEAPASPGGGSHESGVDPSPRSSNVREQYRFFPIANISRIMKKGLPADDKIAKDAKETVQECVSEFISLITSEANDKCQREKRKTVNDDDLLWAMATLGFEDYIESLKSYLTYTERLSCL